MNPEQLREKIIRPVCKKIHAWSPEAEELLMGTAAAESNLGQYVKQVGGGPAVSIYQIEPATYKTLVQYLQHNRKQKYQIIVDNYANGTIHNAQNLIGNLWLATAMARVFYFRFPDPIPKENDHEDWIYALGMYWKTYYNTKYGAGTPEEFVKKYDYYVRRSEM